MLPQLVYLIQIISVYLIDGLAIGMLTLGFFILKNKMIQRKVSQIKKISEDETELLENSFNQNSSTTENELFFEIQSSQYARILEKFICSNQISYAEDMIENQIECLTTLQLSILMNGYAKIRNFQKAYDLLQKMENDENIRPNVVTYNTFLKIANDSQEFIILQDTYQKIKQKDIITYSVYISSLLNQHKTDLAFQVYNSVIENKQFQLDQVFFNIMINGLLKQNQYKQAYQVFETMKIHNFKFNDYSLTIIIQLLSALGLKEQANTYCEKYNHSSPYVNSCIIKMYVQMNDFKSVIDIFNKINTKDQVIYSQVVQFLIKSKIHLKKTCEVIQDSISNKIILRKYLYEKIILVLIKIINYEILIPNFPKNSASPLLICKYIQQIALLNFLKENQILLSKETIYRISKNIQRKIIFEKQLNIASSKKQNLFQLEIEQ